MFPAVVDFFLAFESSFSRFVVPIIVLVIVVGPFSLKQALKTSARPQFATRKVSSRLSWLNN